jgi:hypothetical protein
MNFEELLGYSKKKYIAKIGNTFLVSPMSEDVAESLRGQQLDKHFQDFPSEMLTCLKHMPNVVNYSPDMSSEVMGAFHIKEETKSKEHQVETFEASGLAPNFFDHINFQVVWPRKNQEIPSWYTEEVVETFNIIYDGAIFLAYGEGSLAGGTSYTWQFGLEAMKIIESCFERSNLWKVTKIGPIMLHPAIYFVFLNDGIELTLPTTRVRENDLYIFFPYQDGGSHEEVIENFFDSVAYEVKEHHGNLLLRKEIMDTEIGFRRQFATLCSLHQNVIKSKSWSPVAIKERYSYVQQLRDGIREAYELYVNLMDMQASIAQERSRIQTRLSQNKFLGEMAGYFDDLVSDVGQTDFSPILQGLRFLEDETRMVSTIRSNLQAALIGALVAAIIYAIVHAFLG